MAQSADRFNQFTVFMSNNMESLADLCALLMSEYPLKDPFAHEKVVVMNLGMNKFLSQRIAMQNSISTMCDFKQVWQLIYDTYRTIHPDAPRKDLYDRRHITWNIFSMIENWNSDSIVVQARKAALESGTDLNEVLKSLDESAQQLLGAHLPLYGTTEGQSGDIYERLRIYLKDDRYGDKAFELSAKIADTLDQYQMYRPEWIMEWNKIPLSAFDDYERDPDDPSNPINVFIESQCQRFIREKTGLNAAKRKAAYNEALNSSDDPESDDVRFTFEEVKPEHVTASRAEMVRHLFKSNVWQIKLWCSLRYNLSLDPDHNGGSFEYSNEVLYRRLTHLDRSQVMVSLINELKTHKNLPKLYERVFVFGVSALPRVVIDFLDALSNHCSVNVMLLNPCQEYWADIAPRHRQDFERYTQLIQASTKSAKEAKVDKKGKFLPVRGASLSLNDFDDSGERIEGNPLLLSYGRQGRDNLYLLFDRDPMPQSISCFSEPDVPTEFVTQEGIERNNKKVNETTGGNLLGYIQRQLLFLEQPEDRYVISKDDTSFSVHSCHTKRREVEVLHDAILECFNRAKQKSKQDPEYKLYPRDIVVMVPAINEYAPHIEAVFGGSHKMGDPDYIPYVISDQTERETNTVTEALLKLLEIGNKRITASLVIDLLSENAIAQRFSLTQDNVEIIAKWIEKNNIFWGLNDNDVSEFSEIALPGTFESGMDRMLLGTMLGESNVMPGFSEIEGSDAVILGRFWDFINALNELRLFFNPELALAPRLWGEKINTKLISRFFDSSDETKLALRSVEIVIEDLKETIDGLARKPAINLPVFAAMLRQGLSAQTNYMPFLREKINFCSLVPMRAVPFKHVFILGLNDSDFPREERMPGFNLMSSYELFERGDRSRGTDDRFLFLEAILSARESVYFSYIGSSATDNRKLSPSIVLNELMYYIYQRCSIEGLEDLNDQMREQSVKRRILHEEHLNAYSQENYVAQGAAYKHNSTDPDAKFFPSKLPSFNSGFISIAGAPKQDRVYIGRDLTVEPEADDLVQVVSLDEVIAANKDPYKTFARKTLQIYVDLGQADVTRDDEDFSAGDFQINALINELLHEKAEDRAAVIERHSLAGDLPSGVFRELVESKINEKMDVIIESMQTNFGLDNTDIETVACPNAIYRLILPEAVCTGTMPPDLKELTQLNIEYASTNAAASANLGLDSQDDNSHRKVPDGYREFEITLQASRKVKPVIVYCFGKAPSKFNKKASFLSSGTDSIEVCEFAKHSSSIGFSLIQEMIAQYLGSSQASSVHLVTSGGDVIYMKALENSALRYVITFMLLNYLLSKMRVMPTGKAVISLLKHNEDGELVINGKGSSFGYEKNAEFFLGDVNTILSSEVLSKIASDYIDFYLSYIASNIEKG